MLPLKRSRKTSREAPVGFNQLELQTNIHSLTIVSPVEPLKPFINLYNLKNYLTNAKNYHEARAENSEDKNVSLDKHKSSTHRLQNVQMGWLEGV